jgi:AraC family transcriptional regulator
MQPIPPADVPRWVPGQILLASDELALDDVFLRSYRYGALDVEVPPVLDYTLVAYRRGSALMDREIDGHWSREFVAPGDLSILTRAEPSHWRWPQDIDVVHLYLSRGVLAQVSAEVYDRDISDVRLMDVLKTSDDLLHRGIVAVADEVSTHNLGGQLFIDSVTNLVCVQLLRRYANVTFRETRSSRSGLSPLQAKRIAGYVDNNLEHPLRLAELAQMAHVSSSHFLRQFRSRFGCAPHAYVMQRRLSRARGLLAKSPQSLKVVAARCGFSDQSHMTRVFQRHLNVTPGAYRESVRPGRHAPEDEGPPSDPAPSAPGVDAPE